VGTNPAPNPKLKNGRTKREDFDELDWSRFISEKALLEAIPTVYGCDPRDSEKYKALEKIVDEAQGKQEQLRQEETSSATTDET
jgi:hypothetical protein